MNNYVDNYRKELALLLEEEITSPEGHLTQPVSTPKHLTYGLWKEVVFKMPDNVRLGVLIREDAAEIIRRLAKKSYLKTCPRTYDFEQIYKETVFS